jgi:hypothetical protein
LLDRIPDWAHILETGTESYRFRRTLDRQKKGAKATEKLSRGNGGPWKSRNVGGIHIPTASAANPYIRSGKNLSGNHQPRVSQIN